MFHKIDMLTSLAIHAIPMTLMFHIRWVTMPGQAHLPVEEQRFGQGWKAEPTWGAYFAEQLAMPAAAYLCWLTFYYLINFVLAADLIRRRNYDSTYNYMK